MAVFIILINLTIEIMVFKMSENSISKFSTAQEENRQISALKNLKFRVFLIKKLFK